MHSHTDAMHTRLDALDQRYPLRTVACRRGTLGWREAGAGPAMVLLHGIGSGSLAWVGQFEAFAATHRVMAWDAPGYGVSSPLGTESPMATDYAQALTEWLESLAIRSPVVVGHSLGALVAAAFAAQTDSGVRSLVLASPAPGYGSSAPDVRQAKWRERVDLIQTLGAQGMADARAARLCTPGATAAALDLVRWNMARVTAVGYGQAAHMLAHDQLLPHALRVRAPVTVLCGELDTVTPAARSAQLARELNAPFHLLAGAAHACYAEHPLAFNALLRVALQPREPLQHD